MFKVGTQTEGIMTPKYKTGQKVDLIILRETPLGFVAEINGEDEGLLYHNEIFEQLSPGQDVPGYVKEVRENGRIDLLLHPIGTAGADELGERILELLKENDGFLDMNAKTTAEKIYDTFGVSKNKYKLAVSALYKKRLIKITEEGIELV